MITNCEKDLIYLLQKDIELISGDMQTTINRTHLKKNLNIIIYKIRNFRNFQKPIYEWITKKSSDK